MKRDSQRQKVYGWERSIPGHNQPRGTMSLEECEAFVRRVWRSERGRYGLARTPAPSVVPTHGGGRAKGSARLGTAKVALGVWARQPAVVLHEIAHHLTYGEQHGPRFVGVAIGLYCRHLGADRDELLARAAERAVKVNLTAIGAVPAFGWHRRVLRALRNDWGGRATEMELAVGLGVSFRVVQGALLTLFRQGRVVRRRGRIEVRVIAPEHLLRLPG